MTDIHSTTSKKHDAKIGLNKLLFAVYVFLRFNTSVCQLAAELNVSYRTLHWRVERSGELLDAPVIDFVGSVEIDEVYVIAGLKGRDRESRSRDLSTRGGGTYKRDKPPVFTLADRATGQRYVVPAKSADESTVRHLLADHEEELLTVYTAGFRAYDPLDDDDSYQQEAVTHGEGEYVGRCPRENTCESHGQSSDPWFLPHRDISRDKLTPYLRAFQLRRRIVRKLDESHSNRSFKR